jgi:glucose/arabinose dehydrogenase/putative cell wall-binding protein
MSRSGRPASARRRGAAVLLTAALVVAALAAIAPVSPAAADTARVAPEASTPTDAAVALSREAFDDGTARWAVVARDDDYADALTGAAVAATSGPVLFTDPATLTTATRAELERSLPAGRTVYLMGGQAAVSETVAAMLATRWRVERVAGGDRILTGLAAARLVDARDRGGRAPATMIAAAGDRFADAVTAGAGAVHRNAALLLINPRAGAEEGSNGEVLAYVGQTRPTTVAVMGGNAAVPAAHATALEQRMADGAQVTRVAGPDRAGTAAVAARFFFGDDRSGWTIVRGYPGADEDDQTTDVWGYALAASGRAARLGRPVLLVHGRAEVAGTWDGVTIATANVVDDQCEAAADVVGAAAVIDDAALLEIERLRCAGIPAVDVRVHVEGLRIPWAVADLGDGRLLVTERDSGVVSLVDTAGVVVPVATLADLYNEGEAGLMGITLHPDFGDNGTFYVCATQQPGPRIRVRRLVLDGVQARDDGVVADLGNAAAIHDGCALTVDADGHLLATSGDAANPEGSRDPGDLNGKAHRMTLDGQPVDGNARGTVWTVGHRNSQGIDTHPVTGVVLASEHGPDNNDEINVLVDGGDYGWPTCSGPCDARGVTNPIWASGARTIATSGGAIPRAPQWARLRGAFLVATLRTSSLRALPLTPDGTGASGEMATLIDGDFGRLRGVTEAFDGGVWVTTSNGADDRILHVAPR